MTTTLSAPVPATEVASGTSTRPSADTQSAVKTGLRTRCGRPRKEIRDYAAFVRRAIRGLARRAVTEDAQALVELDGLRRELDIAMQAAIDGLREQDYSWTEIAAWLGVSRQAVQQRYGR